MKAAFSPAVDISSINRNKLRLHLIQTIVYFPYLLFVIENTQYTAHHSQFIHACNVIQHIYHASLIIVNYGFIFCYVLRRMCYKTG